MSHCEDIVVEFSREREVVAQKEHECIECRGRIRIGARHHYIAGVSRQYYCAPKEFWEVRICLQCQGDWAKLLALTSGICFIYGDLEGNVMRAFEEGFLEGADALAQHWIPQEVLLEFEDRPSRRSPLPGQLVLVT